MLTKFAMTKELLVALLILGKFVKHVILLEREFCGESIKESEMSSVDITSVVYSKSRLFVKWLDVDTGRVIEIWIVTWSSHLLEDIKSR